MAEAVALSYYYLDDVCLEEMKWISLQDDAMRCHIFLPASFCALLCNTSIDPLWISLPMLLCTSIVCNASIWCRHVGHLRKPRTEIIINVVQLEFQICYRIGTFSKHGGRQEKSTTKNQMAITCIRDQNFQRLSLLEITNGVCRLLLSERQHSGSSNPSFVWLAEIKQSAFSCNSSIQKRPVLFWYLLLHGNGVHTGKNLICVNHSITAVRGRLDADLMRSLKRDSTPGVFKGKE